MQVQTFSSPSFWRPTTACAPPLDQVVAQSAERLERDLGLEMAEKARRQWGKTIEKNGTSEMTAVWLTGNWMADLKPDQMASQDHTGYVLPMLQASPHPAAPAMLEVVDHFLPTLTRPRDRNHLVESAARALRRSTVEEARLAFGQFCGALSDGGLGVRRYLAEQVIAQDPDHAAVMRFGLEVARKLDDGTPLGQHQASRALYASFFATKATSMESEMLPVMAAALQSHPGNTLWSEDKFTSRFPDTVALITDPTPQVRVSRACLEALGDPLFARAEDPVATLQQIGQLWPERQKMQAAVTSGVRYQGERLVVGGVSLRTKA